MLQLHLNFPRVFVAGCASGLEFRLTNGGDRALSDVRLTLACPALGLTGNESIIGVLQPGATYDGHVEVEPAAVGAPALKCAVEAAIGREIMRLEGVWKRLSVYERPQSPSNVSVIIQDIQSHRSEGDKAEFGGVKGDVNIAVHDLLPRVQSLNDLIQLELPDDFRPVLLTRAAQQDRIEVLRVPETFLKTYQPASVVHLSIEGETASAGSPSGWRLCAGGAGVILGRSSQDCDLVTRFLPVNDENNARSATLSRKHAMLRVAPDGKLLAEALSANALLHVGPATAATGVPLPLAEGDSIALGPTMSEFRLRCRLHQVAMPRRFRITNFTDCAANRATDPGTATVEWGRAELELLNSTPAFWQVIWFQAPVPFGRDADGRFAFNSPDLNAVLGYFHHYRGSFWIESCAQRENAVMVNGIPLDDGELAPLSDGAALEIDGVKLRLARIR